MRSALRAFTLLVAMGAACRATPQVGLDIAVPSALGDATAWFEIGAFRDASCAALGPMLPGGIPDGATTRVAFRREDGTGPRVGNLPNGTYAFAAAARGDDCAVLAYGCVEVNVGDTS